MRVVRAGFPAGKDRSEELKPAELFAYRLALQLGYANPDLMLLEMTSSQLGAWQRYYEIEPWGFDVDGLRSGVVAATVANVHRRKGSKAYKPQDFAIKARRQQSADEMITILKGAADGG